jgi:hypothetical protein
VLEIQLSCPVICATICVQERQAAIDVLMQGISALNPDITGTPTTSTTDQPASPAGAALLQPLLLSLLVAQQQQQQQQSASGGAVVPSSTDHTLTRIKELALRQLRSAHPGQGSYQLCLSLLSLEIRWSAQVELLQQGELSEG